LDQSLSVLLPVHNAQSTLAAHVRQLLDVLPDLTAQFEVLIVDDGSTDHTAEVATDLSVEFPQVRMMRSSQRRGTSAAVQMGLQRTSGDIVFVQDERTRLCPGDLRRLWQLRHDPQLVMAHTEPPSPQTLDPNLLHRLTTWGSALKKSAAQSSTQGGIQMIRRQAIVDLRECAAPECELKLDRVERIDKLVRGQSTRKRPNFLLHLKEFATGE
jgi:glycosyltransferase involved in cell wall biosynthesis